MAKAALTLDQVRNYCVVDKELIPIERVKFNAVTCSDKCEKARKRQRMLLMEQAECKYCRRPSTPAERESFKAWRQWVKDQATVENTKEITAKSTKSAWQKGDIAKYTGIKEGFLVQVIDGVLDGMLNVCRLNDGQTTWVSPHNLEPVVENVAESTGEITIDRSVTCPHNAISGCPLGCPDVADGFPYTFKGDFYGRQGQRCRKVKREPGERGNTFREKIQFEDGETMFVDKMTVSGTKKKYSEKRGRPAQPKSTLAAKQKIDTTDEGE